VAGLWLGTYAIAPHWAALAFAIGMGAIAQVLFEVGGFMARAAGGFDKAMDKYALGGFAFGLIFMYVTAIAIKI
jgi:Na+-transporting NADH:ubiquinone oxidoreductase subunit NqrB